MFRSRWLPLLLVVAALACDQTLPSAPSLGGPRRSSIPSVSASDQSADLPVSGEDQVLYESTNLPDYPNTLIAEVTISGAVHFDGDPNQGPYFQASGDIGAAGFLVNQTCTLRTTITFRIGGLGSQGGCPTAATGDQTLEQTMLINGSGRLELQPSASTRNFCGFTTICWTYSGAMHVKVHPLPAALKLTVENENPDSGETVTATVTTNPDQIAGIAVPINGDVEWDLPDPGVHCNGGNRVCTFTATQSGTLLVTGIVNGATSSDEIEINVQPKPDSMPHDSTGADSTTPCLAPPRPGLQSTGSGPRQSGPVLRRAQCGGGSKGKVRIEYGVGTPILSGGTPLILPAHLRYSATQYDTTSGRPPLFGTDIWPDSLVVTVHVDSAGSDGTGIPQELIGRAVTLTILAVDSAGRSIDSVFGHAHFGSAGAGVKPAGTLRRSALQSGVDGADATTYLSSQVSGPIILRATADGADPAVDTIWVGVPGLVMVHPTAHYDTTGGTTLHPFGKNVWVTPEMLDTLTRFADTISEVLGIRSVFNDGSLPYGGKFDLHQQWDKADPACTFMNAPNPGGCHQTHNVGWDVDYKTRDIIRTQAQVTFIRDAWARLSCTRIYNEGDHIHLPMRDGGALYQGDDPRCQ